MIIQSKHGNLADLEIGSANIDWLPMEWYETRKRIMRKLTRSGQVLQLKFLNEPPDFTQGDILLMEADRIVAVELLACDCLIINPQTMFEMASICYEIGNKHLPLFFEDGALLVPYDAPLFRLLTAQGYLVNQQFRKLLKPLSTTVSPHGNQGSSLFSKIMQLTNAEK